MNAIRTAIVVSAWLVILGASPALAQDPVDFFRPAVAYSDASPRPGGEVSVTVTFDLAEGIHLYKDRLRFEWTRKTGCEPLRVEMPDPARMPDPAEGPFGPELEVFEGTVTVRAVLRVTAGAGQTVAATGQVLFQGCSDELCYPPLHVALVRDWGAVPPDEKPAAEPAQAAEGSGKGKPVGGGEGGASAPEPSADDIDMGLLLLKILQAFGMGVLISLTPCVYPMIGITAAIIGGSAGEERNVRRSLLHSLAYVFGISLTYATLGVVTALAGAPFARFLKSPWVLLPVSGLFLVLALSMFDVITIQTPAFIQTRVQTAGQRKGLLGKFFFGLVSGAVATPCVAAPLIALLLEIATMAGDHGLLGAVVYGFAMLFTMAWGMGVILIAAGVLTANVLPRSGPWMVWVKKLFGFGMIWAAVYFARPVTGEGLFDLLTALVLMAGVVFLSGLDRLTAESTFFERLRQAVAIPVLVLAVLLFTGGVQDLTGWFPWLDIGRSPTAAADEGPFRPVDARGVEEALATGRPVVLDFSAGWCKVCKKLDRETFSDGRVRAALGEVEALRIDYDRSTDLVERYRIVGVPTVVFLDATGRERKNLRFSGFVAAQDFLAMMDQLRKNEGP